MSASLFADVKLPAPIPRAQHVKCDGYTYWAECALCGRGSLPATIERSRPNPYDRNGPRRITREPVIHSQGWPGDAFELRPDSKGRHQRSTLGVCATCKQTVPLRITKCTHSHADKPLERCGALCLNGRRDCSCQCGGRCHGAGVCLCGNR